MQTFVMLTRLAPDAVKSPKALEDLEHKVVEAVAGRRIGFTWAYPSWRVAKQRDRRSAREDARRSRREARYRMVPAMVRIPRRRACRQTPRASSLFVMIPIAETPCPPHGHRPHAYHFRLSALSISIVGAGPAATCDEIKRLVAPY
jgi:hypothetical protein